jgi:hypothetical protein
MGTPAYISPEQAQGNPVDQRSDIYSLGIILYEMVTGSVPFTAETPLAVLFKHISDPLPPPSLVKPDIPTAIEQVLLKALAKDPKDRFATAAEFMSAWKRALETRETAQRERVPEVLTVPPSPPKTGGQTQPRSATMTRTASKAGLPAAWIGGCLIAACALFGLGGVALMASNLWTSASPSSPPPTQTVVFIPPTDPPPPTETPIPVDFGSVLLEDDFSSSQWGTGTNSNSTVEYDNEALQMVVHARNWFVWSTPDEQDYRDVHMEVTVINNGTDTYTAFGLMCNQQPSADGSYYYFAITPAGQYTIAKATEGETDVFLTNNNQWGTSSLIPKNAASYRIGANCGKGRLTLYVDGQQIATASDSSYISGGVAVFTWSVDEENATTNVSFDNFLMKSLE